MTAELHFDASEIDQLSRAIAKLPGEIKVKAMARAMRRMRDMSRTRVVSLSSKRVKLPPGIVRKLTTAHFNAGGNTVEVIEKSGWIPLFKLGARQTRKGVTIRSRGSYEHAFLATMKSGHRGVFRRVPGTKMQDSHREAIRELFGPNPAHDVTNNPEEYIKVLAELIEDMLLPRVLHEIGNILPR